MNQNSLMTCVVSLLATVLLYYSAAWSVLGCFDRQDDAVRGPTLSDANIHTSEFLLLLRHHVEARLDCVGTNYHTETLAGSSSLPKLQLPTFGARSDANDSLVLQRLGRAGIESLRLRAVFESGFALKFSTDSPRYLSLSALRL